MIAAVTRWLMAPGTVRDPSMLAELLERQPAWMARAACRGEPVELFFPVRGESAEAAKAICARCPVADECLDYAVGSYTDTGLPVIGIWGGTSGRERRQIRSARRLDQAG